MTAVHIRRIDVMGTPAPQGSKRHVGRGIMVESSAKVKPWREAVKAAAAIDVPPLDRFDRLPVRIDVVFRFSRPKGHYGSGRNSATIKPAAPPAPAGKPDLDKLLRSTFDALTDAGVFRDDSQVVDVHARKAFCVGNELPGATVLLAAAGYR